VSQTVARFLQLPKHRPVAVAAQTVHDQDRWSITSGAVQKSPCPVDHLSGPHPEHGLLDNHSLAAGLLRDLASTREELGISLLPALSPTILVSLPSSPSLRTAASVMAGSTRVLRRTHPDFVIDVDIRRGSHAPRCGPRHSAETQWLHRGGSRGL
jgi:hypothetical protein